MIDIFKAVRDELVASVRQLRPQQSFHILFWSDKGLIEGPDRKLVPVTEKSKLSVVKLMETIRAEGKTDPAPALVRAFEALRQAGGKAGNQTILLVTDGVFPDNRQILETVKEHNARKEVRIHTVLLGRRTPGAEDILKRIAEESGGEYRYASGDGGTGQTRLGGNESQCTDATVP